MYRRKTDERKLRLEWAELVVEYKILPGLNDENVMVVHGAKELKIEMGRHRFAEAYWVLRNLSAQ